MFDPVINEDPIQPYRLGRLQRTSDRRALMLANFLDETSEPPVRTNFWTKRVPFPLRTFGNTEHGCCTRAKQAIASMRMERIEQRRTIDFNTDEILRVYYDMTSRLYGGGDTGAYEIDALSEWRKPDLTFRDQKGRPVLIDAYLQLNPANHREMKHAIWTAGAKGIAVCLNLPAAWRYVKPPADWDCPADNDPALRSWEWRPGSWGGHSMWDYEYDEVGLWLDHTWDLAPQRITWRAAARYLDEAHLVIDSVNEWKRLKLLSSTMLNHIVEAVNGVSSQKVREGEPS